MGLCVAGLELLEGGLELGDCLGFVLDCLLELLVSVLQLGVGLAGL